MAKVSEVEDLADVGGRLLANFHQGLEFIRHPPINRTSDYVEHIFRDNETKRLLAYVEVGCVKSYEKIENFSICSNLLFIIDECEAFVRKVASEVLSSKKLLGSSLTQK